MMTGIILRALSQPAWLDDRRPEALFGASCEADWSEPERLLVGVLLGYLEPDPTIAWSEELVDRMLVELGDQVAEMLARPARPPA